MDYVGKNLVSLRANAYGYAENTTKYEYDYLNRLTKVTLDPGTTTNGVANKYETIYTYDGDSTRVASISQTDGSVQSFTYVQVGDQFKIATMTDTQGNVTTINYDPAFGRTDVIDPMGYLTSYFYDIDGQLTKVQSPAVNGVRSETRYVYDSQGNVLQIVDGNGNITSMTYDASGNQIERKDALGNTVTRVYDGKNQLLLETVATAGSGTSPAASRDDW